MMWREVGLYRVYRFIYVYIMFISVYNGGLLWFYMFMYAYLCLCMLIYVYVCLSMFIYVYVRLDGFITVGIPIISDHSLQSTIIQYLSRSFIV